MKTIILSDQTYAELAAIFAQAQVPLPTVPVTPVVPPVTSSPDTIHTRLDWRDANRVYLRGAGITRAHSVDFTVPNAFVGLARIAAAEWGGGGMDRIWTLHNNVTGELVASGRSRTLDLQLVAGAPAVPRTRQIGVIQGHPYSLRIKTPSLTGEASSDMLCELYI